MARKPTNKKWTPPDVSVKQTYERLGIERQPYITRAINNACLTVPNWFPDLELNNNDYNNYSSYDNFKTPEQSMGSSCVNGLSAKLFQALFPINVPFFKLSLNEYLVKQYDPASTEGAQIDQSLSMIERILSNYMEQNAYRGTLSNLIKQLIVAGNGLVYMPVPDSDNQDHNPPKLYKLYNYVVERDAFGKVLKLITEDKISYSSLSNDVKEMIQGSGYTDESILCVYTYVYYDFDQKMYHSYETINDQYLDGSHETYPEHALPFIPVRLNKIDGENYGRSYVEEYYGDLRSLEDFSKSIREYTVISSKIIAMVNPTGITQPKRIIKAKNGDFVPGNPSDVAFLQPSAGNNFQMLQNYIQSIETRLAQAFLLNQSATRDAERVTAAEVQFMANQLESVLSGVYISLSSELQMPIIRILLNQLQATNKIPDLPKEALNPSISTGSEALGRGQDLTDLQTFIQAIQAADQLQQDSDINISTLKLRLCNAIGIDTSGLLLSPEEKAEAQAQQAQQQLIQQATQSAGQGLGQMATQNPETLSSAMDNLGISPEQLQGLNQAPQS